MKQEVLAWLPRSPQIPAVISRVCRLQPMSSQLERMQTGFKESLRFSSALKNPAKLFVCYGRTHRRGNECFTLANRLLLSTRKASFFNGCRRQAHPNCIPLLPGELSHAQQCGLIGHAFFFLPLTTPYKAQPAATSQRQKWQK